MTTAAAVVARFRQVITQSDIPDVPVGAMVTFNHGPKVLHGAVHRNTGEALILHLGETEFIFSDSAVPHALPLSHILAVEGHHP